MITGMPRIAVAVHDFPTTVATFSEKLGMPVVDMSDTSVTNLGAKLAMCIPEGGSNIEIMSPADPDTPLSQSLQRFLDRRGEGLFALMLEAPDPDAEAEGNGVDKSEHRLRQAYGCHGVRTKPRHEEHIDHGEHRLHHRLQYHGDSEKHDRAAYGSGGIIVLSTPHGFTQGGPEAKRFFGAWFR